MSMGLRRRFFRVFIVLSFLYFIEIVLFNDKYFSVEILRCAQDDSRGLWNRGGKNGGSAAILSSPKSQAGIVILSEGTERRISHEQKVFFSDTITIRFILRIRFYFFL
jgi:hypothetical protein